MNTENTREVWDSALQLPADKMPLQNLNIDSENLKYYLTHEEYNILLEALKALISDYNTRLEEGNFPGGGEGSLPPFDFDYTVLTSSEDDMAIEITTEDSMFTALRVLTEIKMLREELVGGDSPEGYLDSLFLSKKIADIAQGIITFMKGIEFTPSDTDPLVLEDSGYKKTYNINQYGVGHLRGLKLDEWLEVPELRFNRVEVTVGDFWRAPGGGKIKSVEESTNNTGIVHLKLDDGEMGAVAVGDLCLGIFHFMGDGSSNNAEQDFDDGKGNRRIKGFASCYFEITEVYNQPGKVSNSSFKYKLRDASEVFPNPIHPQALMSFVGYGNRTKKNRQSSAYQTRTYERFLTGINNWEYGDLNIAAQFGDLTNISHIVGEHDGYSVYLNNVYISGNLEQIKQAVIHVELGNQMVGVVKKDGEYDLSGATTDLHVFLGDEELRFIESTEIPLTNGTYHVTVEGTDITPGELIATHYDLSTFLVTGPPTDMLSASASIEFTITIKKRDGKLIQVIKRQTIQETQGVPGVGVENTVISYQIGDSGTIPPVSTWLDDLPEPVQGKYLWTRTRTIYTDGTHIDSYSVSYFAIDSEASLSIRLSKDSHTYTFSSKNEIHPKGGEDTWAEGKSVLSVSRGGESLKYISTGSPTYSTYTATINPTLNIESGAEGDNFFVYPEELTGDSLNIVITVKTLDSKGNPIEDTKIVTYNKLLDGVAGVGVPSVFRGLYNRAKKYYGNSRRIDIVQASDGNYYRTTDFSGDNYEEYIQDKDPTGVGEEYWIKFGINFDSIATGLLLAEEANIAEFSFKNQAMYSQNGWIENPSGVFTEITNSGGDLDNPLFKSNLYFSGKTGEFQARTGYIGGFTIHKDMLQSTHGTTPSISLNGITGAGHLAGGNISWNGDGEVTFGPNVTLSWNNIPDAPTIPDGVDDTYIKNLIDDSYIKSIISNQYITGTVDDDYIKGIISDDYIKATFEEAIERDFTTKITSTYITTQHINTLNLTSLGEVTAGRFSLGNGNFVVNAEGNLTAKNVDITGKITATSGAIGGFNIVDNVLTSTGNDYIELSGTVLKFYKNGVLQYDLGPGGITLKGGDATINGTTSSTITLANNWQIKATGNKLEFIYNGDTLASLSPTNLLVKGGITALSTNV